MSEDPNAPTVQDVADWWATAVSRVEPDVIELRGRPVQELIGTTSFVAVIWLLLRGDLPTPGQERLLEAALVSSVDHGPHAPSIAVARMAVTCGIGLNNAIASGVNTLGDVHGGAGEQCMTMMAEVIRGTADGMDLDRRPRLSSRPGGPDRSTYPGSGTASTPPTPGAIRCWFSSGKPSPTGSSRGLTCAQPRRSNGGWRSADHDRYRSMWTVVPLSCTESSDSRRLWRAACSC